MFIPAASILRSQLGSSILLIELSRVSSPIRIHNYIDSNLSSIDMVASLSFFPFSWFYVVPYYHVIVVVVVLNSIATDSITTF